jgi:hypothetical protein
VNDATRCAKRAWGRWSWRVRPTVVRGLQQQLNRAQFDNLRVLNYLFVLLLSQSQWQLGNLSEASQVAQANDPDTG